MANGTVRILQNPEGDRYIDNESLQVEGQTVYRQRVILVDSIQEKRLDYGARTDGNPVYVGKALQGTATSAETWDVQKLDYDSSSRLTRVQILHNVAWGANTAARDALGWS